MAPKPSPITPTRVPSHRPSNLAQPTQTPPITNTTNTDKKQQSTESTDISLQRSVIPPSPKAALPSVIRRPDASSNRDVKAVSGSGFHIRRPNGDADRHAPARPVLPPQRSPASGSEPGSAGDFATQQASTRTSRPAGTRTFSRLSDQPSNVAFRPAGSASVIDMIPAWASDAEAKFRVRGLPPDWFTEEIHREMISLGNVTYIDIPREQGKRSEAYVTFTPPPRDHRAIQLGLRLRSVSTSAREVTFHHMPRLRSAAVCAGGQEEITVDAARIDFGVMKDDDTMLGLHSVQATPSDTIQMSVNKTFKRLDVRFSVPSSLMSYNRKAHQLAKQLQYRLQINLAQITSIVQMQDHRSGETSLVLTIEAPPLVYRKTDRPLNTHEKGSTKWTEWKTWLRQTEIEQNLDVAKRAVKQLQRDSPIVDLGRWLTYRLTFDSRTNSLREFRDLRDVLQSHSISLKTDQEIKSQFAATKAMAMWSWLDSPVAALKDTNDLSSLSDLQQMAHQTIQLPFEVRYQLESCISHGCIHECNVDQEFLQKLSAMAIESEHGKVRATKLLEKVVDEGRRFYDPKDIFKKVVPNMRNAFKERQKAANFIKVMTATVTPTSIYFNPPSLEPSNRVIRHFRQHESRFLRVRFTDEKYKGKIHGSEEAQDIEVFTRVKRTMSNGIKVGDRVYEFLAFGNSQFKENGAYFFAPTGELNAAKLRDWMGNFSHIKIVAKYCSRIGQGLSTTRATQNKTFKELRLPDIERNGFCFSDGVGKISPFLAKLISSEIGMLTPNAGMVKGKDYPSAFQFRMGGCKGVLVVDPTMGSDRSVAIRPSQEKFSMVMHTGLEICRISQFTNASLNVQIILVLSTLGVGDMVFRTMMTAMLSDIELAMTNEAKAIELLQKNIDLNQMTVQIAQMILDGFMEQRDPFMMSCLQLWRSWSLKYLKEKQRIFVEDGAFVLGCIDETASLEGHYDNDPDALPEIFLQIPDREHEGRYTVVEGICMLARNPSLHPGDIRIVRAVHCESLMHIHDCVVLPQKGDRDVANMCSGGDLDGDDYMIIWDKQLLPKASEWNHPPMDYQAPATVKAEGEITVDDMTSFFVTHMKYNNVGRIATQHRYWADLEHEGVKSQKCLELAAKHSMAVDYAKTGQPADLPKRLLVHKKPHWAQSGKNPYHSNKVIGQLYDLVKRVDFVPAWELPFDTRILEAYQLDGEMLEKAKDVKEQYDEAICRVMAKYKIKSEFEVWSTFVLEHSDDYNDYKFAEKIGEEVYTLKESFQKLCHDQISSDEQEQKDWSKKGAFVAAMYTVTAREVEAALAECEKTKVVGGAQAPLREKTAQTMPFMSFPWLFTTELGWIANKRSGYSASSSLHTGPSKQIQQAAKTKLRQDILGDVPQPAPLQELFVPDMLEDEDEEDLLDVQYTGPRLIYPLASSKSAVAAPMAKDSVVDLKGKDFVLGKSDDGSESGKISVEEISRARLSPLQGPGVPRTDHAPPSPTLPAATPIELATSPAAFADTPSPPRQDRAKESSASEAPPKEKEGEDSGEEAEEVFLPLPTKKSAFDALEELLAS